MPKVSVVNRSGLYADFEATPGTSLMENLRGAGFDEIMALCGGCCSCATCHVIIDAGCFDLVGEAGEDESELLDSLDCRASSSRLSCQIMVTSKLEGLRLTIAPEE